MHNTDVVRDHPKAADYAALDALGLGPDIEEDAALLAQVELASRPKPTAFGRFHAPDFSGGLSAEVEAALTSPPRVPDISGGTLDAIISRLDRMAVRRLAKTRAAIIAKIRTRARVRVMPMSRSRERRPAACRARSGDSGDDGPAGPSDGSDGRLLSLIARAS